MVYKNCAKLDNFCELMGYRPLEVDLTFKSIMYFSREDIVLYLLWKSIYNFGQTSVFLESTQRQCAETMSLFYEMNDKIPAWFNVKIVRKNKCSAIVENDCKIMGVSSMGAIRGYTISNLIVHADYQVKKNEEFFSFYIPFISRSGTLLYFK